MPTRKNPLYKPRIMTRLRIPQVSDYPDRATWEKDAWLLLIKQLKFIKSFSELISILAVIISPRDQRSILRRAAAIHRIESGVSYSKIGFELWLAPQTIAALRRALAHKTFKSYAEFSKKNRRRKVMASLSSKPNRASGRIRKTKFGSIRTRW